MVECYKHHRLVNEYNDMMQRVSSLQEQIKQTQDKRMKASLSSQLKSLLLPPLPLSSDQVPTLAMINSRAKDLYDGLKVKEDQMMVEAKFEASMLYEVDRLNVLNLLKVFEVDVTWSSDHDDAVKGEGRDERIDQLEAEKSCLQNEVNFLLGSLGFD